MARLRHDVSLESGVVQADGRGGGFERREAVVVVRGVEQLQVQDGADALDHVSGDAHGAAGDGVVEGLGRADYAASAFRWPQEPEKFFERVGHVVEILFPPLAGAPEVAVIPEDDALFAVAEVEADITPKRLIRYWD